MIASLFYPSRRRYTHFAWAYLAYNIIIILSGAVVRATGSGAGCGNHWPTCNGQIVPTPEAVGTMIEFSHRLLTGFALPLGILIVVGARRLFGPGTAVRRGAVAALFFLFVEALIGAFLVRAELVADNASATRAIVDALHLGNTMLLLAAIALTAWWAGGHPTPGRRPPPGEGTALGVALLALVVVAMLGVATALGDTLFPVESLSAGLQADRDPTAHFLIRLRLWHPLTAVLVAIYLVALVRQLAPDDVDGSRLGKLVAGLVAVQLLAGTLNILLLVPIWLQLVHLALADALWIAVVLFSATRLVEQRAAAQGAAVATNLPEPQTAADATRS